MDLGVENSLIPFERKKEQNLTCLFWWQACLNAPDPTTSENGVEAAPEVPAETPEDVSHNNVNPTQQSNIPRPAGMHPGYMTSEQQQQMASYYQNLQQQQQAGGQYPGMSAVGNRMPTQHQPTA